jgi:glycosyltransferase involved in cell wall biosynthesis
MACGVPVVCSNNSSLPEAAGDAAVLVDAQDLAEISAALARVAHDQDLRAHLRENGFSQVRRFTWDAAARALLAAYERVYHG